MSDAHLVAEAIGSKHTPIYGPFSRTTQVSWYQKGKTNLDFTEARDAEWQWHQPDGSLHHSIFTGRMPFLPPNQQHERHSRVKALQ